MRRRRDWQGGRLGKGERAGELLHRRALLRREGAAGEKHGEEGEPAFHGAGDLTPLHGVSARRRDAGRILVFGTDRVELE